MVQKQQTHSDSTPNVEFNEDKFKELVVYIAERYPDFGDTKLNKALAFSDFLAYAHFGESITGAAYQKLQFGPAARKLLPLRRELVRENAVKVETRGGYVRSRLTMARREPDVSLFSQEELDLVDEVLDVLADHSAESASEFSHRFFAGWQIVNYNEDIPYETVFISTRPAPPRAIERGLELVAQHGW